MRYTDKERYAMPERRPVSDPADIEPLADNFKRIDERLQTMEADKAGRDELQAHAEKKTLDHPDGSVTDEKIGNRTIGGMTGKLTSLFSAIGNAIKGATGTANWNDTPPTTLVAAKAHADSKVNPHGVTKAQVGLGSADNTSDTEKPVSAAQAAAIKIVQDDVTAHKARRDNPHAVTKSHVGLGSVDNTGDASKPISIAQAAALEKKADLDSTGKVPAAQLPSYVDDVLEYVSLSAFPASGESGKIYIAIDTNKTYRWGGSAYVVISETLALGETASTAYRGDRGKAAYDHSVATGDVHGLGAATQSAIGLMAAADKVKLDGVAAGANNYIHPATHPASMVTGLPPIVQATGISATSVMSQKAVTDAIGAQGNGDMLKSIYDTNNNGAVDNAEKVNGLTVQTAVPAGAKFTDTVYTHPNSGAVAGTYRSVAINAQGHVTAGSNPTTMDGYGIADGVKVVDY